jgi:hypothetical protein
MSTRGSANKRENGATCRTNWSEAERDSHGEALHDHVLKDRALVGRRVLRAIFQAAQGRFLPFGRDLSREHELQWLNSQCHFVQSHVMPTGRV